MSADGKKHKTRTSINPHQLDILLEAYAREQKPSKQMREDLMAKTGLDMKVIQVWFQNRRSKEKRDASYREAMKEEASTPTHSSLQGPLLSAAAATVVPTPVSSGAAITIPSSLGTSNADSSAPLSSAGEVSYSQTFGYLLPLPPLPSLHTPLQLFAFKSDVCMYM